MAWRPLCLLLATAFLAGCLQHDIDEGGQGNVPAPTDLPLQAVADRYYDVTGGDPYLTHMARYVAAGATGGDVRYHTFEEVEAKIMAWNETYPDLVYWDVIGTTRLGLPIWHVVITDENWAGSKIAPLLDGGHHGNEYGGSEIMLYTADLILANHATNLTIQQWLRDLEIHIVPIVNPDGYVAGTRHNSMGVNLNRNYDVDWGNPLGTSNPVMGQAGAAADRPVSGAMLVAENCGASAFSEPETSAIRDLMATIADRAAFYLTGHTPTHAVIAPPAAFDPPFQVPDDHRSVLDQELSWIRTNTEYEAGRAQWGDLSAGLPYAASGSSMDHFYATAGKPAFTVEVEYFVTSAASEDYPLHLTQAFEGLRYWMDATVPIPMHLLANAKNLAAWQAPVEPPLLPEGLESGPFPERPTLDLLYLH